MLAPFSLPPDTSVTFKLSARQATLAVSIAINGPPVKGIFSISPNEGVELQTKFTLFASRFSDPDLPLAYTFGFYPSSNSTDFNSLIGNILFFVYIKPSLFLILGVSEISYVETNLPAGQISQNFTISCVVICYDSLSADSSMLVKGRVSKLELDDSALNQLITSKLNDALSSGDLDVTRSALSVSAAVINFVNCSRTTDLFCAQKNRFPCTVNENVCGTCFDGFISSSLIGNDVCFSLNSRRLTAVTKKTCTDDCNSNGVCVFRNVNTGAELANNSICSILDPTCEATCICNTGYDGNLCSYTSNELQLKQGNSKLTLILKLLNLFIYRYTSWVNKGLEYSIRECRC